MITNALKRELRSAQTLFPGIRKAKFGAYNWATQHLGWRIEPEFRLLGHLPRCNLAIDVGGNWGQSILALKRCCNPAKIISFEPNAVLAAELTNCYRGDTSVTIEPVGLSSEHGEFELHIPSYRKFVYDGLASLNREESIRYLNHEWVARFDPSLLDIMRYPVVVKRLDDFGLIPDVIKIDVQGLEQAVVQGGIKTITAYKPAIIVEAPPAALIGMLGTAGLNCYVYENGKLSESHHTNRNNVFLSEDNYDAISCGLRARET